MRLSTRLLMYFMGRNMRLVLLIPTLIGLLICGSLLYSESLNVLRQIHLSVYGVTTRGLIIQKTSEGRNRHYVTASYLVKRADGSVESLRRKGEISNIVFEKINQGDEVEIVYSSQRPGAIWMLKEDVDLILGTALLSCFGFLLVAMGGGGLMLMRDKR